MVSITLANGFHHPSLFTMRSNVLQTRSAYSRDSTPQSGRNSMLKVQSHVKHVTETGVSAVAFQQVDVQTLLHKCHGRSGIHSLGKIHCWMTCNGLESIPLYADYLIRSFASCSALLQACQVFLKVQSPTAYTWNAIISAHAQHSHGEQALSLFIRMQLMGVNADRITFLTVLKVCSDLGALAEAKLIHMMVVDMGSDLDLVIGSTLVHTYGKCSALDEARRAFDVLPNPNVVSWGALINGHACYGDGMEALRLFEDMQARSIGPEKATFLSALKACSKMGAMMEGKLIHDQVIRLGLHEDMAVTSALMDMYGKCKRLLELQKLFRDCPRHDVVSLASFMSAYTEHGDTCSVFDLLEEMEQGGIMPDPVIFLSMLRASIDMAGSQGRIIHDHIIKANLETDMAVANSLVYMYAKNGTLQEAEKIFSKLKVPDIISCSAMISGYIHEGYGLLACDLFEKMQAEGIQPDRVSFLGMLKACGSLGAVHKGRQVHAMLIEGSIETNVDLGNTLVDMYAKCGCLREAQKVFDKLSERDLVSWRALISGYAQQDDCMLAVRFVESMQRDGFRPDDAVFMSVLAACSHAGLLKEGQYFFNFMRQEHISPSVEHYNCMIDLQGRMGDLIKAEDMLQTMPASLNFVGWSTLLNVCRSHGNSVLGTQCFSELSQLDCRDASSYMLMSSILTSIHNGI